MTSPRRPTVTLSPESRRTLVKLFMRLQQNPADTTGRTLIGRPGGGGGGTTVDLRGDVTGATSATVVGKLQGAPVARVPAADGQALVWDATAGTWKPGAPGTPTGLVIDFSTLVNQALSGSGAVATASSTMSRGTYTYSTGYIIDNDDGTWHNTESGFYPAPPLSMIGQWIQVDLGAAKAITYYRWDGSGPREWKLQSSPDGTTWTDRHAGTGSGIRRQDTGYIDLTGPHTFRYWRFLITLDAPDVFPTRYRPLTTYTLALYSGLPLLQAPGHLIQDEGAPLVQRRSLDFVGQGVTATDDPSGERTVVTIPGTDVYATDAELAAAVALLISKGLIDAKGDLIVGTADNTPSRVAVGADGQVLTADATQPAGVKWAPAAAPTIRYEPLTNGNPAAPELVFDAEGDVIMVPVP